LRNTALERWGKYGVKRCRVEWLGFDGANGASGFAKQNISKAV